MRYLWLCSALLLLLACCVRRASATRQCFQGTVAASSTRTLSPCAGGAGCTLSFSLEMDLAAQLLHSLGILVGAPDSTCMGALYQRGDYSFSCTTVPLGGGQQSVNIVARIDYTDGYLFLRWQYSGIALSCASFNATLAPVGATLQVFEVHIQPPDNDTAIYATVTLDASYTLSTLQTPCASMNAQCLTPPQRCYRRGDTLALISGTQPSGTGEACAQQPGYCDVQYQFRVVPALLNSTNGALNYTVNDLQVTFPDLSAGWPDYCLGSVQSLAGATFDCAAFSSGGQNFVRLRLFTAPFELAWVYNLDNETLSCQDALFEPERLTEVRGYVMQTDVSYSDNLVLTDTGTSQWVVSGAGQCSDNSTCLVNGDCQLALGANATCTLPSNELNLIEVACDTLVTPNCNPTSTPSNTATPTQTPTQSATTTGTPSSSPTGTGTNTPTNTITPTGSASNSATRSPSYSNTASVTSTQTPTPSRTPSNSPTASRTSTQTPSNNQTTTPTPTSARTQSRTQTPSSSFSKTPSATPSVSRSSTQTPSTGYVAPASSDSGARKWRTAVIVLSVTAAVLGALLLLMGPGVAMMWRARARVAADRREAERLQGASTTSNIVPIEGEMPRFTFAPPTAAAAPGRPTYVRLLPLDGAHSEY